MDVIKKRGVEMSEIKKGFDQEYKNWLREIKEKIKGAQIRAALAANRELLDFYYDLGRMILEKDSVWGSRLLERLSIDLKKEFPQMQGFSVTNLKYCRLFFKYFLISPQTGDELEKIKSPRIGDELDESSKSQFYQAVVRIPWGHVKLLIDKIKDHNEALFYINQTIENGWSRDILALQIKSGLFERSGKAVTNFKNTLPEHMSDLAQQTIKDPYRFDFMTMTKPYVERDLENQLIDNISKFLLELGKGFAFVGRQYHLEVGESDYYIDLLFYHIKLKCYVVIELKNTKFIPEYAGKLNFYLSAVDSYVKGSDDNPTIGILLCRDKNNIEAEFALRDIGKPMGVSEFEILEKLPENLRSSLPTVEEIETELQKQLEEK
jgi:predicted nuclease of restriction endonuclease-like (RecB) superfamily